MTIDEAIEILEKPFPRPNTRKKGTYSQAMNLAIEALEFCAKYKLRILQPNEPLLPSEAKNQQPTNQALK